MWLFQRVRKKNLDREDWLRLYVIKSLIFKGVLVKWEQRLNSWSRKYIRRCCVIKWKLKAFLVEWPFWSRAFFEDPGNAFWDQYGEGFQKIYYFLKIGVTFKSKIDRFFGQGSTFQYQITLFIDLGGVFSLIMVHFSRLITLFNFFAEPLTFHSKSLFIQKITLTFNDQAQYPRPITTPTSTHPHPLPLTLQPLSKKYTL